MRQFLDKICELMPDLKYLTRIVFKLFLHFSSLEGGWHGPLCSAFLWGLFFSFRFQVLTRVRPWTLESYRVEVPESYFVCSQCLVVNVSDLVIRGHRE